jgi:hypothetical protein
MPLTKVDQYCGFGHMPSRRAWVFGTGGVIKAVDRNGHFMVASRDRDRLNR